MQGELSAKIFGDKEDPRRRLVLQSRLFQLLRRVDELLAVCVLILAGER